MTYSEQIMFFTPAYFDYFTEIKNSDLVNYIYELKSKDTGRSISNVGGWQSKDFDLKNDCINNYQLYNLVKNIEDMVASISESWGMQENIMLANMWANVNLKNEYNLPHSHPGSVFSGVYYVKCNKLSGDIVFNRPDLQQHYILFKENNPYTFETYKFPPEEGKVVIFPSHLSHYVLPNMSDEERISIAFNFIRVN